MILYGGIALGVLVLYVIITYNRLIGIKNRVLEAWSGIDVQLKKRYDLIPNLVNTVKGYASHESGTLEKVIQARNMAVTASKSGSISDQVQAENVLAGSLRGLFAVAESYPDLKANASFLELQAALSDIKEELQNARRFYNALVRDSNTAIEVFPANIIAGIFNFQKFTFFEITDDAERKNPVVQF
ncbi:MAG: LemA family protein [Saprospiraceae bacterium]|nr:LemA family protein [Saprospiraceae bacterium]